MSKMDCFSNLSPLNTTVSRKGISFSDISAVNFALQVRILRTSSLTIKQDVRNKFDVKWTEMIEL